MNQKLFILFRYFRFLITIIEILFFIFMFYFCLIFIHNLFDPRSTTKHFFLNKFTVSSESMVPTLNKYDEVFIVKTEGKNLKPSKTNHNATNKKFNADEEKGDIVAFYDAKTNIPIIHRVIKNNIESKTITTLGDNNKGLNESDKDIHYDDILGKYVYKIDFQNFRTFKIFILLILCLYLFLFFRDYQKSTKIK